MVSVTSTGMYSFSVPALCSASSSTRVLAAVPEPSSTSSLAAVVLASCAAAPCRIERSVRVG